jgi:regulator of sirC expression with transglutaminase-like and TPR domain
MPKCRFRRQPIAKALLSHPEDSIDLAKVEIAVERLIDPSINPLETLRQSDRLADATRARFPQGDQTDPQEKALILMSTMRDPGPWNGNRAFSYDVDHPLGENPKSKLLSHFLATRKGNCVSMPVMYVVLAQKLGLPVTLSTAPYHVFAKFRMDDGDWTNLESPIAEQEALTRTPSPTPSPRRDPMQGASQAPS